MSIPDDAFTAATLFTLGGSATGVWLLTSVIGYLIDGSKPYLKWISFVASLILAFLGVYLVKDRDRIAWFVAFFNGLIIFLTAVGENEVVGGGNSANRAVLLAERADVNGAVGMLKNIFAPRWFDY